ncbi:MAG TPA: AAA family ATPase [Ktedonosporobacter sp.]|jgi:ABC-type transport system involved in cytochrome c biogenesis ATPase subunit|nr:AAA family ATPase [Ktedonosporobacter sp.]
MSDLILDSLEIRRFRSFRHLSIAKLGRVNLIVGKNNVGKSCLLEALQLYAGKGFPNLLWQILHSHDEDPGGRSSQVYSSSQDDEAALSALKYLFYGRKEIKTDIDPVSIGPVNAPDKTLSLTIKFYASNIDEEGRRNFQPALFEDEFALEDLTPRLSVWQGEQVIVVTYPLSPIPSRLHRTEFKVVNCVIAEAGGLDKRKIGELWDKIALTDRESQVLAALRIIAPGIEGISIVGDSGKTRERFTIVKVAGMDEPVPIRSLGDGMQRMLGIALALVNAENGLLLIDEVENGLHYSIQTDLWRLIFQVAQRLNIQVFATSHSWDCIEAFQKAAQENEQEGGLIRLEHKKGEVVATIFDEHELAIATREQIEIR